MKLLNLLDTPPLAPPSLEQKNQGKTKPKPPSLLALTPLLGLLIPLIIGYSLAERVILSANPSRLLVLCCGLGCMGLGCRLRAFPRKGCIFLGLVCCSLLYASYRKPVSPPFSLFVTKEASLELKIERVFSGSKLYFSGLGRIFSQEAHLQDFNGKKVYFRAKKKANPLYQEQPYLFLSESIVQVKGVLRPLLEPKTDFERFLQEERTAAILDYCRFETVVQEPSSFVQWCGITVRKLEKRLHQGCEPKYAPIYTAMVLGRKTTLAPETKRLFLLSGTMHIFAISGLHIGIVAAGLWSLGKLIQKNAWAPLFLCDTRLGIAAKGLGLGLIYLYVGLTGFSASAERAFLMLCLGTFASVFRRQSHLLGTLVSTATCMLLWDPSYLSQLGFQLSFAAVGGIALYGLPLAKVLSEYSAQWPGPLRGISQWLLTSLAVSLGASLACAPLCIQAFKVLAYGGVWINLLLLPLASMTVLFGVLSSAMGCVSGLEACSVYLNKLAGILIAAMEGWIRFCLEIPYMYILVEPLPKIAGPLGLGCVLATMLGIHAKHTWSERLFPYTLPVITFLGFYLIWACLG